MTRTSRLKTAVVGFVAAGVLALGATAQAVDLDAGVFTAGNGDFANPKVFNVDQTEGFFLDTINFDLGSFTHFNMTTSNGGLPNFFGASIFKNLGDVQVFPSAFSFTNQALPDLGLTRDYHIHPSGVGPGSYNITMWGSMGPGGPAVPLPAAAWLFGSGVIGLVGLARRKMTASV